MTFNLPGKWIKMHSEKWAKRMHEASSHKEYLICEVNSYLFRERERQRDRKRKIYRERKRKREKVKERERETKKKE